MTKRDREELKEILDDRLTAKLAPMNTAIELIRSDVSGQTGNNGLKGEVKDTKKRITLLERFAWMFTGGLIVLGSGVFYTVFIK